MRLRRLFLPEGVLPVGANLNNLAAPRPARTSVFVWAGALRTKN